MENITIQSVGAVSLICYLAAELLKATPLDKKWLPAICGALGAALGLLGMLFMPDYPAQDPMTAIAVGIVSGLAATGANQAYKQLSDKEA